MGKRSINPCGRIIRRTFLASAFSLLLAGQAPAQERRHYDIPAQDAASALREFGRQSGIQVLFPFEIATGRSAPSIRGEFADDEVIDRLAAAAGLVVLSNDGKTVALGRESDGSARPAKEAGQGAIGGDGQDVPAAGVPEMGAVVVTGTRIRGGEAPSPVITIGSGRIREEGFADLGEVIRSVPQNFSGGQSPGIAAGATGGGQGNQNITGGSGLNLRGLGQDASLTLLNGRRMSYGGFVQMVDISAIPVEAVERIEIVADGASAIYGSDAVGGVGNVILRRDFDGLTIGTRHGAATEGGLTTREYAATAGASWSTGGLIATWKKSSNDPIRSDQRDYAEDMYDPSTLYQGGDLRSGLLSAHQSLGSDVELRLDALRTERESFTQTTSATVNEHNAPETTASLVSPGIELFLPNDWTLSVGGTWGKELTDVDYTVVTTATGASTLSRPQYSNKSRTYEASAEGPLFPLHGGDARLAVGAGYRYNDFVSRYLHNGETISAGDVSSRFAYAELSLPLIGPERHVRGVRRLVVTAAIRGEDYDSFGGVTTPKLGLIYGPGASFTMKASWGRSFKVPTLSQQYLGRGAYLFPAAVLGGSGYAADATALYLAGGNPDLDPERARTWSASLAFHPRAIPGMEAELSWFDVDYTDRVVQPLVPGQALGNPIFSEFIIYSPTGEELADILAHYSFINATGMPYDAGRVVAIAPNVYTNASRQRVRGLDLSGTYRFDLGRGRMTIRGSASRLDNTRQVTSGQSANDLTGTLFHPARISSRIGAVWSLGGFTTSLFGNYKSGVTNTMDDRKGASFTTFDATLRYDAGERGDAWSGLEFELSVQNLLDRAPPLYARTSLDQAPYDSTNYSAIGRYLGFSVSKHW